MPQTSSVEAFQRSLNERFHQLSVDLEATIEAFALRGNDSSRLGPVKALVEACRDLHDYLAAEDRPLWLQQVYRYGQGYLQAPNPENAMTFLKTLLKHHHAIRAISFSDEVSAIDFDALFVKYRDEGRIRELFDELIRVIQEIVASGDVDSIAVVETLNQILELLRKNRDGSFIAVKSTIKTTRFLKHLIDVYLEKIPVLKDLREAYDRTLEEAEKEVDKVESAIRTEVLSEIHRRVRNIERLPNYDNYSAEFTKQLALPPPSLSEPPTSSK